MADKDKDKVLDSLSSIGGSADLIAKLSDDEINKYISERLESAEKLKDIEETTDRERRKSLEEEKRLTEDKIALFKKFAQDNSKESSDRIKAANEVYRLEEKRLHLLREEESTKKSFGKVVGNINSLLRDGYNTLKSLNDPWAKIDAAASKYTKTLGGTKAAMDQLRKSTLNSVLKGHIGINYNMSAEELLQAQENYSKAVGRNIRIGASAQESIAAMSAVMGADSAMDLSSKFENFGVSLEGTAEHAGRMFANASKAGISFERYSDSVKQNISIAQNYTFRNGLKGLESMAQKAASIKLDMQMIAGFADKVSNVEGAIDTSAKLQVLGGPFASMADPMGMLNEGLNDMEALADRVTNMVGGIGSFDKATGEVKVSSFNKQRIKAAAEAMGMDYGKLMETVNASAKRNEIGAQINASTSAAGLSEEMKELVKNSGSFKNGKAGVSINGEFKTIDQLSNKDYKELVKETQSESQDIKDIAKNLRSLVDMREGARKQKDTVQAYLTSGLGQLGKMITDGIARSNWLLAGILALQAGSAVGRFFDGPNGKRLKGAFKNGGGRGSRLGGIGRNIKAAGLKGKRSITRSFSNIFGKGAGRTVSHTGGRAATSLGGKAAGKAAGKLAGKTLLKGVGGGAGLGIAGAVGNMLTDRAVAKGKITEGSAGHTALKAGSSALEGAGIGMAIGSIFGPMGTAIGGALGGLTGGIVGIVKSSKAKNAKILDNQLQSIGIERKGKYSNNKLKDIDKALETGKMSNRLRRKLAFKGDTDIINQVNKVKDAKKKEKRADREAKKRFGVGHFSIGTASINVGRGNGLASATNAINPLRPIKTVASGIRAIRGIKENGFSAELQGLRRSLRRNVSNSEEASSARGDFNVNINGTIRLEGAGGQGIDITKDLVNNPVFIRQITDMISQQMERNNFGTNRGDSRPYSPRA